MNYEIKVGDWVCFEFASVWVVGELMFDNRSERIGERSVEIKVASASGPLSDLIGLPTRFGFADPNTRITTVPRPAGHRASPVQRQSAPAPQFYGGLTAEQCLAAYECAQQELLPNGAETLTDDQLAAASELWSAQLRARVQASKERERCQVVIDQDLE